MDSGEASPIDRVVQTGHAVTPGGVVDASQRDGEVVEVKTSTSKSRAGKRSKQSAPDAASEPGPEAERAVETEKPSGVLARALGAMREQNGAVKVEN